MRGILKAYLQGWGEDEGTVLGYMEEEEEEEAAAWEPPKGCWEKNVNQ